MIIGFLKKDVESTVFSLSLLVPPFNLKDD